MMRLNVSNHGKIQCLFQLLSGQNVGGCHDNIHGFYDTTFVV